MNETGAVVLTVTGKALAGRSLEAAAAFQYKAYTPLTVVFAPQNINS